MKYTNEIVIALPREKVVALVLDSASYPKWQKGLQSLELVSGEPGMPGAVSKLVFLQGRRKMQMEERIMRRELPEFLDQLYTAPNVRNIQRNRFVELGLDQTKWMTESEFEFSGFMKLVGLLFKGAFPKQTQSYLQAFKAFSEDGKDVREARP